MINQAQVTFVSPCSSYHLHLLDRLRQTVSAQTVPCKHVIVIDEDGMGAGMARNIGIANVTTPFLVFLDADDTIAPTFAEETLSAYDGRYVYTDWTQGGEVKVAADCHFADQTYNVITCLIPTAWVLEVGGFDTGFAILEDTDFFLKLLASGRCGNHLHRPLFHYSQDGKRSKALDSKPQVRTSIQASIKERYRGKTMGNCAGCGGDPTPINESKAGYVLVEVTNRAGQGGQPRKGRATGIIYEYAYVGDNLYVHPDDADHPSGHFARIQQTVSPATPSTEDFESFWKQFAVDGGYTPQTTVEKRTDKETVIRLWGAPKADELGQMPYVDHAGVYADLAQQVTDTVEQLEASKHTFKRMPTVQPAPEPPKPVNKGGRPRKQG